MFDHFIWSVVVCPAVVALVVRLLADRLRPEAAVRLLVTSIAVAATASLVTLTAFGLKALAELPATGAWLGFSDRVVRADTAAEPWVSWLSLAMLLAAVAGLGRVWHVHRRDTGFARRYADLPATGGVVLVDDERAEAFAVPAGGGRIVVTTGMRSALDDTQFAALLAHERAHLEAGHHRLALLTRLAAAAHPLFWWLSRRIEFLVERAADEQAATRLTDRRAVARAIGAAALVSAGTHRAAALRVAPARRDLRRAGVVPRRVASLLAPPRPRSWLPLALPAAAAVSSVVWTGECVIDLGELLHAAHLF